MINSSHLRTCCFFHVVCISFFKLIRIFRFKIWRPRYILDLLPWYLSHDQEKLAASSIKTRDTASSDQQQQNPGMTFGMKYWLVQ